MCDSFVQYISQKQIVLGMGQTAFQAYPPRPLNSPAAYSLDSCVVTEWMHKS